MIAVAALDWRTLFETVGAFLVLCGALGAGLGYLFWSAKSNRIKILEENLKSLEEARKVDKQLLNETHAMLKACDEKHDDSTRKIDNLEKKVELTQTIPLEKIATHMEKQTVVLAGLTRVLEKHGILEDGYSTSTLSGGN